MKKMAMILFFLLFLGVSAQNGANRDSDPNQTIELFFEAFHQQDTAAMRALTFGDISLRSIVKDKTGEIRITSENFDAFLKAIASIPESMDFQEKIHGYEVKTDGTMAHVWTTYSFFVNGKLSHCGVNSFQLFKFEGNWKIISILDTRRKDCGDIDFKE